MRILLLEPDRLLMKSYSDALQRAGHHVTACSTAQRAVQVADEVRPDAVVMELQLIGHSGVEFLYEFRSYTDWMDIPVIIHTHVPPGEFSESRNVLMHELNVQTYLYKLQTTLEKLVQTVGELAIV